MLRRACFSLVVVVACESNGNVPGASPPRPDTSDSGPPELDLRPDAAAADTFPRVRGGSRLEARGFEAEGMFVFDRFFDTKLGLTCDVGLATDGIDRCIPRHVVQTPNLTGTTLYSDATCTTEIVSSPVVPCSEPSDAVVRYGIEYRRLGGPVTPATVYHRTEGGPCGASAPAAGTSYYAVGESLPLTELVGFTRRSEVALANTLRAVVLEGDDGSREQAPDFVDAARSKSCFPGRTEDGRTRCIPTGTKRVLERFADATCTRAVGEQVGECSARYACDESVVVESVYDECGGHTRVHAAGATFTGDVYRRPRGTTSCDLLVERSGIALGPRVEDATMPELVRVETARGRLVERTRNDGAATALREELLDASTQEICRFAVAADGVSRCLPIADIDPANLFTDSACTRGAYAQRGGCLPPARFVHIVEAACPGRVHVHPLVPAPTALFRNDGTSCVPTTVVVPAFVAGEELPATSFVEGVPAKR